MPFALSGEEGRVEIVARGIRHEITFRVDRIAQRPVIDHRQHPRSGKNRHRRSRCTGPSQHAQTWRTRARDFLPLVDAVHRSEPAPEPVRDLGRWGAARALGASRRSTPAGGSGRHRRRPRRTGTGSRTWSAWPARSCPMTGSARRSGVLRDFLAQFDGLTGTAKRKAVLDDVGLQRAALERLLERRRRIRPRRWSDVCSRRCRRRRGRSSPRRSARSARTP